MRVLQKLQNVYSNRSKLESLNNELLEQQLTMYCQMPAVHVNRYLQSPCERKTQLENRVKTITQWKKKSKNYPTNFHHL